MKSFSVFVILFSLFSLVKSQTSQSPIRLERELPAAAKNEEYFRGGMEEKKRIDNIVFQKVAPSEAEKDKFRAFLSQPKTGIFRLLRKKECLQRSPKRPEEMLEYGKNCPTSYLPGNGKNFSFRRKEYVDDNQSDITFKDDLIFSNGLLNQALMVNLKDTLIENISLEAKELVFLRSYIPAVQIEEVDKQISAIDNGIENNNFLYAKGFKVNENSTFALRVIAYKANLKSYSNAFGLSITFDPFYEDIREDILVVFKVFNIDHNGVTMVWRELERKKSPTIKLKK